MKNLSSDLWKMVMCLAEMVIGILLFINPVSFTSGIIMILGVCLVVLGVVNISGYFRMDPVEAALQQNLAKGLCQGMLGFFCVFRSKFFIMNFPVPSIVYGIAILLSGIYKTQWAADMARLKRQYWFVPAIGAAVSVLAAVVVLLNPFSEAGALWMFTAIALIIQAMVDLSSTIFSRQGK